MSDQHGATELRTGVVADDGSRGEDSPSAISEGRARLIRATDSAVWELIMGALAIAFVLIGLVGDSTGNAALLRLDGALSVFFAAEYGFRLAISTNRLEHVIDHWVDAIALIPAVRGLRILRLLRLVRLASGVHRASANIERLDRIRTLVTLLIAWIVVMAIGAIEFYSGEAGVNPDVNDPADAVWWSITTITGGQNEILAATDEGRLAAVILLVGGAALFAAITASILRILAGEAEAHASPSRSSDASVAIELVPDPAHARVGMVVAPGRIQSTWADGYLVTSDFPEGMYGNAKRRGGPGIGCGCRDPRPRVRDEHDGPARYRFVGRIRDDFAGTPPAGEICGRCNRARLTTD